MSTEITITLPDGSQKQAPVGISGLEIASMIGAGLAKAAIAFSVNGEQRDLSDIVCEDSNISIFTVDSDEGLEIMRHTVAAQVLARAIKNLYPSAKLAIGPTIDDGFYYDFYREDPFTPKDLEKIEIKMTLTAPGCGMGPVISEEVDRKVNGITGVNTVSVDLVWEPMWNRDMMSEEAKLELGML